MQIPVGRRRHSSYLQICRLALCVLPQLIWLSVTCGRTNRPLRIANNPGRSAWLQTPKSVQSEIRYANRLSSIDSGISSLQPENQLHHAGDGKRPARQPLLWKTARRLAGFSQPAAAAGQELSPRRRGAGRLLPQPRPRSPGVSVLRDGGFPRPGIRRGAGERQRRFQFHLCVPQNICREKRTGRFARDLYGVRRGGGHSGDPAGRRRFRGAPDSPIHHFQRAARPRAQRGVFQRRRLPGHAEAGDEHERQSSGFGFRHAEPVRRVGQGKVSVRPPAGAGSSEHRQHAGHQQRGIQPFPSVSAAPSRRIFRGGVCLQPDLQREFSRAGGGGPVRPRTRPDGDSPERLLVAPAARRTFSDAGSRSGLFAGRAERDEPDLPPTVRQAPGARPLAGPGTADCDQQLGEHRICIQRGQHPVAGAHRPGARRGMFRAGRRMVRRAEQRTRRPGRLDGEPGKAAGRRRGAVPKNQCDGDAVRAVG